MGRRRQRSAGVLVVSGARILLLRRAPHMANPGTWGLPGGRRRRGEDPWAAALRESAEEVGHLPPAHVLGEIRVVRPTRGRYDVFVCRTSRRAREAWAPALDGEHDAFRWVRLAWCLAHADALQPVLRRLLADPAALRALAGALERGADLRRRDARRVSMRPPRRLPGARRSAAHA